MDISKIGVTRIIPTNGKIYGAYKDFVINDCVEIRERILKNGSRIIAGYADDSNLANFVQKINKKGFVEQEKFYSSEPFGIKEENKETQLEKITYNKIGDKLKHFQLFKTFKKGVLTEKFEAFMDIVKGVDKSERNFYNEKRTIKKERINNTEYNEEIYRDNILTSRITKTDVDSEGLWKY